MLIYLRLIKESLLFAWQAIVVNKLRTLLSLLGVTVGIFSIITVLTLVDTMEHGLKDSFDMLADDVLFVQRMPWGPDEDGEYKWWEYFQRRQPSLKNMEELRDRIESAQAISFQANGVQNASFLNNVVDQVYITAVSSQYDEVIKVDIQEGRYLLPSEADHGKNVVVIGADVATVLFGNESPINQPIKLGKHKAYVVGVFKKEGASLLGNGFDQAAVVPFLFGAKMIDVKNTDTSIIVKAKEGVTNNELKDEIVGDFRSIRRLRPGDDNDFAVNESSMIASFIDSIFGTVNVVGWLIGIFSIIVGGFSIANIMFVSVKERTNIIGIQKALGAKNFFILLQFLFESVALCLFGGLGGLLLIVAGVGIANAILDSFSIGLYMSNFVIGILISVVIGILSGLIPAIFASSLNPVDAIRSK